MILPLTSTIEAVPTKIVSLAYRKAGFEGDMLSLSFELVVDVDDSDDDREAAEKLLPGAATQILRGKTDRYRCKTEDKSARQQIRIVLTKDDRLLFEGTVDVVRVVLTVHEEHSTVAYRFRATVSEEVGGRMLGGLDSVVSVEVSAVQLGLFEGSVQIQVVSGGRTSEDMVGTVVTVDGQVLGRVERTDAGLAAVDLDGTVRSFDPDRVESVVKIAVDDDVIASFQKRCRKWKADPSWADVVTVVGSRFADGRVECRDGAYVLDSEILDASVGRGEQASA